jgi:hypothetical protein
MLEAVAAEDITLQVVVAVMEVAVLVDLLLVVVLQIPELQVLLIEVAVVVALALKDFQTREQVEQVEAVL